jgi:hypothetical protein
MFGSLVHDEYYIAKPFGLMMQRERETPSYGQANLFHLISDIGQSVVEV